ncbi:hypothetical protein PFISCL1PPCAC_24141, partial [Pristionchus fissidentatus]
QGFFTLLALLGVVGGTAPDTVGGTSEERRESMTCNEREGNNFQLMEKLGEAENKVKEAVTTRDQILEHLIQARSFRRLIGEETSFCELPGEILSMIISNLPFRDQMFSRVSNRLFEIEKKAPQLRTLEDTDFDLIVYVESSDEMFLTHQIDMGEEEGDIERKIILPFDAALSMINRASRTMKLKGIELRNIHILPPDQLKK